MKFKRIRVTNFKSFREIDIELGNLNIVIGANASGKSNFVQIFRFLKDIVKQGLNNAISLQGGSDLFRNINIGTNNVFSLLTVYEPEIKFKPGRLKKEYNINNSKYEFTINFNKRGKGFSVGQEQHETEFNVVEYEMIKGRLGKKSNLGSFRLEIIRNKDYFTSELNPETAVLEKEDIISPFLKDLKISNKELFIKVHPLIRVIPPFEWLFGNIPIYDFDPKLPKKAVPLTGSSELEEDGNNLALALKGIIENKDEKRKFTHLLQDLLPFVDSMGFGNIMDRSLFFKLKETYNKNKYLPSFFLSDGTINITALILALYFEEKPMIIIEEPERNLHPNLISKLVGMFKEVSEKKQIIVTTQNPELVRHAGIENLLLVSRDKDGFSVITRPADNEQVKVFLENEIGIDELYVKDLLGV
ncbi:MAG: AAA family ATPase [Candidatus Sumerlaeota bacterium]|nr:AAA family ATPase [Candidatus Sumerlaeota bacterium]